jgi:hypothetical protein
MNHRAEVEQLSARQQLYVLAAFRAAANKGQTFDQVEVGKAVGLSEEDCNDLARILERQDVVRRMAERKAALTDVGRELGKVLEEQSTISFKSKSAGKAFAKYVFNNLSSAIWGAISGAIGGAVAAYIILKMAWVNRKAYEWN